MIKGLTLGAWRYRHFIISSIKSEFRARIARSRFGLAWMVLQPLAQVTVYALILSAVISAKLPGIDDRYGYALYLMAGMFGWALFNDIVLRCLTIFVESGNLLKKLVFPRICLPIIVCGSALINSCLLLLAIIVVFLLLGHIPSWTIVWLPILVGLTLMLALGLGLLLGIINVFVRDVGQIVAIIMQFWFWFTPIVYLPQLLPEAYRGLLVFNPLYPIITSLQNILVFNKPPMLFELSLVCGFSIVMLILTLFMFRRASPEMVDVL